MWPPVAVACTWSIPVNAMHSSKMPLFGSKVLMVEASWTLLAWLLRCVKELVQQHHDLPNRFRC